MLARIASRFAGIIAVSNSSSVSFGAHSARMVQPPSCFPKITNRKNTRLSTALSDDRIAPEQESILQENFFLAVPRNSRYAEQDSVNLLDTVHEGFISLSESKPVRSICDYFCLAAGFTPHIIFESDSLEAVRNLISAGLGIGFWPEYSWGELPKKEVKLLRVEKVDCRRDIIVTITDQGREKQAVADFHDFLLEYTRDLVKR